MEIIRETREYAVVRKAPGEDSEKDMPQGFFCVHRLDRAASGLLVYGKTKEAAAALTKQLQEKQLRKSYRIVIAGTPDPAEGEFQDLLFKDSRKQKMFPVKRKRAGVKEAKLRYRLLKTVPLQESAEGAMETAPNPVLSLVEVELSTGRFHQIRAQFAARRLPLVGDGKYGSRVKSPQLALFSDSIRFQDPKSGEELSFKLELPEEFPWKLF